MCYIASEATLEGVSVFSIMHFISVCNTASAFALLLLFWQSLMTALTWHETLFIDLITLQEWKRKQLQARCIHRTVCTQKLRHYFLYNHIYSHIRHLSTACGLPRLQSWSQEDCLSDLCKWLGNAFSTVPTCSQIHWEMVIGPSRQNTAVDVVDSQHAVISFHHSSILVDTKPHWIRWGLLDKPLRSPLTCEIFRSYLEKLFPAFLERNH